MVVVEVLWEGEGSGDGGVFFALEGLVAGAGGVVGHGGRWELGGGCGGGCAGVEVEAGRGVGAWFAWLASSSSSSYGKV
jgi:hypothetical protein